MSTSNDILDLERSAARAVPHGGPEVHGWSVGVLSPTPRRVGSTTCFGTVPDDLEDAIDTVEDLYEATGIPATFRLTPLDATVDAALSRRGYRRVDGAKVMRSTQPASAVAHPVPLADRITDGWLTDLSVGMEMSDERCAGVRRSLEMISLPLVVAHVPGRAVGLAVLDGLRAGIFDVAVHPAHRGNGLGGAVVDTLADRVRAFGTETTWLQVHPGNGPAIGLYRERGFREVYRYHYRIR